MIQGYVKRISTKTGTGKRGVWTLYSGIIEKDDGTESGWISFGFEKPPFAEGSYISLETETTDRGLNLVQGSAKVLTPPAKPAAAPPTAAGSSGATSKGAGNYVDRNDSIVYQSSRKDSLALVALLLEHDALPISASTAKAGQAKRFEEIKAYVDKLTVEFFNDVQTGRIFQSVVDAGAAADSDSGASVGAGHADND